jgi:2-oxoisovalerate dehydrogenase E1 component alpha subunit
VTTSDREPDREPDGEPERDEMIQLLTPEGERVDDPRYPLDLGPDELRRLYTDMALARRYDTEAVALQRQGELGLWPPLAGQEAAQVGSGRALRDDDVVFPSYREHAVALLRGIDPLAQIRIYRGIAHGGWDPREHNVQLYTIVLAAQTLHAVGYAMGLQRDGSDAVVITYFGDGASSQGDTNEALVWAAVNSAPVVFFCQNNQWAISTPVLRQSRVALYRRGRGFGVPGVRVDGNDVLACFAVTQAAAERARSGGGPTLIEAVTYRLGPHTTSDDPTRYRLAAELEEWRYRDPLTRMETYLRSTGIGDDAFFADVQARGDALAATVRSGTLEMADPDVSELFEGVYADRHALVEEEARAHASYLASFADEADET